MPPEPYPDLPGMEEEDEPYRPMPGAVCRSGRPPMPCGVPNMGMPAGIIIECIDDGGSMPPRMPPMPRGGAAHAEPTRDAAASRRPRIRRRRRARRSTGAPSAGHVMDGTGASAALARRPWRHARRAHVPDPPLLTARSHLSGYITGL